MTTVSQLANNIKQQYPQLGKRPEKAVQLVKDGKVHRNVDDTYSVDGSREHPYTVSFWPMVNDVTGRVQEGGWHCTCPDALRAPVVPFYGSYRPTCKHILAVGFMEMSEPMTVPETDLRQKAWEMGCPVDDYGLEAVA